MRLDVLLNRSGVPPVEVSGMTCDSRQVRSGDLFVALQGGVQDGHDYIEDAIANGASSVLCEKAINTETDIPIVRDSDLVADRNCLAARLYGDPSKELQCIGVTGTNGKTSIAYGLASLLRATGFAGSLGWGMLSNLEASDLTTMDGIEMQARLAAMRDQGARQVAIEASSHALDQGRLSDVQLDIGIYTNFTRDHLDYHHTMANYAAAKQRLFSDFALKRAIINVDDWLGRKLARLCKGLDIPITLYGTFEYSDVSYRITSLTADGAVGLWRTKWGNVPLKLPVCSEFGVANCAAILATLVHCGDDLENAARLLKDVKPAPGRLEAVKSNSHARVFVDYAHTPDSLRQSLMAMRALNPAKLICVFGCGGDRDEGKRPLMGAVAEEHADKVVITNDNPRSEDPMAIAKAVLGGMKEPDQTKVLLDRENAIAAALRHASEGSIVLIAGKGAERYQEIDGKKFEFDDREIVKRLKIGVASASLVD